MNSEKEKITSPINVESIDEFIDMFTVRQKTIIDLDCFELDIDPGKFIAHITNKRDGQYWTYFGKRNGNLFIYASDLNPTK